MAEKFYTILTAAGKAKIANALPTGQKVNLSTMKFGDSNGAYYTPSENQTELKNTVYKCNITTVNVDEKNPNWITLTSVIPPEIGGFTIREIGVYDNTNTLIAVGKYPETYKPVLDNGSTKELYVKMTLEVSNTNSVELKVDPYIILATKNEVEEVDKRVSEQFNTIKKISGLTEESVYIYVDSSNGDDNGDGTIDNPYKTIQRAFDSIPKVINNRHTVFCAPGTYDEEPYISGVIGGSIYVMSYGDKPDVTKDISCRVKALRFYDMMSYVHIEDFGEIDETMESRAFILFSRCIYGSISRCRFDKNLINTTKRTIEWDGSNGSIGTSYFDSQFINVYSQNGSNVRVDYNNTIGSQCNRALYAEGGFIMKNGDVQWHKENSTYPETIVDGGQINGRSIYDWENATYENGWATSGNIPLQYRREGNLCILTGWITKSTLDTTTITTIPSPFRPKFTQRHKVTIGGTSTVQTSEPVLNISPNGVVNLINTGNVTSNIIVINVVYPIS